jgi:hypothetical protein
MKKNAPAEIQAIVDEVFPHLVNGQSSLDSILAAHPQQADELRPYLESALWLASQQTGLAPRPGYISGSKHRLVNTLEAASPPTFWQRLWRPHSPQRFAIQALSLAVLVVNLALVVNTLILASRLALPGDWLYPAKLSIEHIQLALTFDPQEQANLQIEQTQHRTTEIVQLVLEDEHAYIPAAVERLETQINAAVSDLQTAQEDDAIQGEALIASMKTMLENETFILTLLRDMEPAFAQASLDQAITAAHAGLSALNN